MKRFLVGLMFLAVVGEAGAQGDWRSELKSTVEPEPSLPGRGVWPASVARVSVTGGVTENWGNGVAKATWNKSARQQTIEFSPETMLNVDVARLTFVIYAAREVMPTGNFQIRRPEAVGQLRSVSVGYFLASQVLYQATSGVVGLQGGTDGVMRGGFDITAVPVMKAKGKVSSRDKPIRIRGQFAVAQTNP